ncbi:MAG: small-conductance mechanosensitive channel [Gammaproteobacteria bacterium]|jgi:small-conductance mechanosensitive channel
MSSYITSRIIRSLCALTLLAIFPLSGNAVFLPSSADAVEKEISVPTDITPDQVGNFVAPLNEQQVRELLIANLEATAKLNADRQLTQSLSVIDLLKGAGNPDTVLGRGVHATIEATGSLWHEIGKIFEKMSDGQGFAGFLKLMGLLAVVVVAAGAIEWLCLEQWRRSAQKGSNAAGKTDSKVKSGSPFLIFSINLFSLFLFMIAGYVVADLLTLDDSILAVFVSELFGSILVFRFFCFVFKLLLFPSPRGLSLIDVRISYLILYRCMAVFTFCYAFGTKLVILLVQHGLPTEHMVLLILILFGVIINPIVFWFAWTQRYDVDRILFGSARERASLPSNAPYPFASRAAIWPSAITFIITLAFLNWQIQTLMGDMARQDAIEIAWWVTLLFPIIDLLVSSLLIKLVAMDIFQTSGFQRRKFRITYIIRSAIRFIMLTILTLSFLEAWGFQPLEKLSSSSGSGIVSSIIDIGVTVLLGFIIWEAIQLGMERHLPETEEEEGAEVEGEGGGVAATRSETLLPLFRTILLILLIAIVVTSVLYSLGVQIGPLLAGASVVGIAIGFGSQKLVQDIISGMFFLIDDAFRRGEYVEVAGLKGTIEKLSMRSMRLRHHLGAVQTIPYGEISTVKNVSRDWVIMKLELRLPYDVDIEKVRKIIKKIGQEMIVDEVTGPMMLQPLKSQGVMRVEESALIIRMKFTAKPGEQWIVRRVAYTRVRDALADAGIEFAHREIKVRMPAELEKLQKRENENKLSESPQLPNTSNPTQREELVTSAVGAAAMSAVVASELERHGKLDDEGGGGESL